MNENIKIGIFIVCVGAFLATLILLILSLFADLEIPANVSLISAHKYWFARYGLLFLICIISGIGFMGVIEVFKKKKKISHKCKNL